MILPEVILWKALRHQNFKSAKFRRQMPVGPFIADFGCLERKLILEVDGASHDIEEAVRKDERRTAYLRANGFEVFRISAASILGDLNAVLDGLEAFLEKRI